MGQAFDRDGNVLGSAEGDSMREVLDSLQKMHPGAEEIRIKAMREKIETAERTAAAASTPPPDPMEQFFAYAHLPAHLQAISAPFGQLATHIVATLPRNPERTVALRKLLEAKDCAVRALLFK